jgi:hypothetical protein
LAEAYGDRFTRLSRHQRAVLLKALLVHPARWPEETAALIRETVGPADPRHNERQRDNIRRYLGYGMVAADDAIACAADRATFWAVGTIGPEQSWLVRIPVPLAIHGQALHHALWATLAWFTPVRAGRRTYRAVRLSLLEPHELDRLAVKSAKAQPNQNQSRRGTVISRRWEGPRAPAVVEGMTVSLVLQREPDTGCLIDEAVPFGLAVTLTMPGVVEIYDQVRQSLDLDITTVSQIRT